MIKQNIEKLRRRYVLGEEDQAQDLTKIQDQHRELIGVTLATLFDKYLTDTANTEPGDEGYTDAVKKAEAEFVQLVKDVSKNPMLLSKSLKLAKRQRSATKIIGKSLKRVAK
jgi:hypothetical protein